MLRTCVVVLAVVFCIHGSSMSTAFGQTRIDEFRRVPISGHCVPAARALARGLLQRDLPALGANGGAALLWSVETPGFAKRERVRNGQLHTPPRMSFVIWSNAVGGGYGHVALVVGHPRPGVVEVVDSNWRDDRMGLRHEVNLQNATILGYLVPN
jgi:hypothetical protein